MLWVDLVAVLIIVVNEKCLAIDLMNYYNEILREKWQVVNGERSPFIRILTRISNK